MRGFQGTRWSAISHVEAEQHDVAILRYILFALRTQLACVTRTCLAIMADIVFISDGLSTDEAALAIDVNGPCRSEDHTSELHSLIRISFDVFFVYQNNTPKNNRF